MSYIIQRTSGLVFKNVSNRFPITIYQLDFAFPFDPDNLQSLFKLK